MSKFVRFSLSSVLLLKISKEAERRNLSFADAVRILLKEAAGDNTKRVRAG